MTLDYQECERRFKTARWPEKGKPINGFYGNPRIFKRGDDYVIRRWQRDLALVHPDGTATLFFQTSMDASKTVLPYQFWIVDMLGLCQLYLRRGTYLLYKPDHWHTPGEQATTSWGHTYRSVDYVTLKKQTERTLFNGARVDLSSGQILNPSDRPAAAPNKTKNQAAAKAWSAKVREFNRIVKVSAKMGLYDEMTELLDERWKHYRRLSEMRDMVSPRNVFNMIARGAPDHDLVKAMIAGGANSHDLGLTACCQRTYNRLRHDIFVLAGVYNEGDV